MILYYIKSLKDRLKKSEGLVSNFLSLSLIQAANFVLPLAVIPHLIKVIGVEYFGLVAFSQALMQLFIILTDYGFNLSATKSISIARDNLKERSNIFNSVLQTKLVIFLLSAMLIIVGTYTVPALAEHRSLYLFGIVMVLGQTIIPVWFFQGIEQMRFLTIIHLISKVVFTALIFIFIKTSKDYIYVNLLYGLGGLVAGIFSVALIFRNFSVSFKITGLKDLLYQLSDSFPFFLSNLSNNIYIYANIIILKMLSNDTIVGYYSVAEKIFSATKKLHEVLFVTVYPHACKLSIESTETLQKFFTKFFYVIIILFGGLGIFIFIFAEELVTIIATEAYPTSVFLLKLLSFAPLITALNVPAYQTALIYNYRQAYVGTLIVASVINVGFNLYLASLYGAQGTILTILITETFVTVTLHFIIWRKAKFQFLFFPDVNPEINTKIQ